MEFNFAEIEGLAKQKWRDQQVYKVENGGDKPKFYVLDMFPYPSGAGLHVGHPLGYIASDIFARYKRLKGFNVLHPMGFDAFGLPAEQYAIQTGKHPAVTTAENIKRYKEQLEKIGFCYDWSREVSTCDPEYYRWTQWIFLQLFDCWYDKQADKARGIAELVALFEQHGTAELQAACDEKATQFDAAQWKSFSKKQQQEILMQYRLAYQSYAWVNWCPALGTVLANDEIVNGVSERGGHPVEKKKMSQWFLRITAYAERLLNGLDTIDWTDSLKEQQRNWIGKSTGAMLSFALDGHEGHIDVFTTRVDTVFGVTFMVIAPEHELVTKITTPAFAEAVKTYQQRCAALSDIERQQEKEVSGQFTGAYVLHPFTGEKVPVFIADYVLAGYGTGAVMAVPSGDQRDFLFAKKFDLPIVPILDAQKNIDTEADPTKEGRYINSGFINDMTYAEAIPALIARMEEQGIGYGKIQYRMRDAGFSRQRYWGEPFPVYYDKDGIVGVLDEKDLPLVLPPVDNFKPSSDGRSPLANAVEWVQELGDGKVRETDTMPAFAGSSWYFLRYMDPNNDQEFVSPDAQAYWQDVDLYVGGTEHAVGHLLYSRFWNKFFKDMGWVSVEEPFKKLLNQGMIGGRSLLTKKGQITKLAWGLHIPIELADKSDRIYRDKFETLKRNDNRFEQVDLNTDINWETDEFGLQYLALQPEFDKMSKSKYNVVNPDEVITEHGADCFRMFEMFLGPIEAHKPWDTKGISGVSNFLRKFWRLFHIDEVSGHPSFREGEATAGELKVLHKTIKKINEDIERFSFNTAVSAFMICVNELGADKQHNRALLEQLVILIAPFAPFMAEGLWDKLSNSGSVVKDAVFPIHDPKYLVESTIQYPISINGKVRNKIDAAADLSPAEVEAIVLQDATVQKWLEGKAPKKVIVVPGRIVNVVV
jgi:leucyl-tRNA synthetase